MLKFKAKLISFVSLKCVIWGRTVSSDTKPAAIQCKMSSLEKGPCHWLSSIKQWKWSVLPFPQWNRLRKENFLEIEFTGFTAWVLNFKPLAVIYRISPNLSTTYQAPHDLICLFSLISSHIFLTLYTPVNQNCFSSPTWECYFTPIDHCW